MNATTDPRARQARPYLGHGVGLRVPHYERALAGPLDVDWVELISENFMRPGGRPLAVLERVRRDRPVVLHGVGLGIGSVAPLDRGYLARLRALADRAEPAWVSDHLCFTRIGPHHAHDLLPLPYTEEALALVVERVAAVQDALGRPLVLENVSSYVRYAASAMTEWAFLAEIAARADCRLLLDLNNVVVSAANHGFDPADYLAGVPGDRIWQLHLANHDVRPDHRFDSHRGAVPEEVWRLYDDARTRFGPISTSIEWDEDVPGWETLRDEQRKIAARTVTARATVDGGGRRSPELVAGPRSPAADAGPRAPDLATTQRLLWDVIRFPTGAADYAARHGADAIDATFGETARWSRLARLEVHAGGYFWRLFDVLAESFPALAWIAGRDRFHDLVTDYLLAAPPTEPDVGRIAAGLPGYVAHHPLGASLPAAEIAAVEWAIAEALHGPDDPPATTAELGAIPLDAWPSLCLAPVATARSISTRLAVDALRVAARRGDPVPAAHALPLASGGAALVWRRGFAALVRSPDADETIALARLFARRRFDELTAAAAEPTIAARWLARWVEDGLIARAVG